MKRNDPAAQHRQAWEVIPWVVNGSADDAQRQLVHQHAQTCADCRAELARQRELHAAFSQDAGPVSNVDAGVRSLFRQIDHAAQESRRGTAPATHAPGGRARSGTLVYWLAAAIIVEAAGLSALGLGLLFRTGPPAPYQTLSEARPAQTGATIRLVPAPDLRAEQLQQLLQATQLQVVSGPNAAGAYGLAPLSPQANTDVQLAALRAAPGIRLAEPLR